MNGNERAQNGGGKGSTSYRLTIPNRSSLLSSSPLHAGEHRQMIDISSIVKTDAYFGYEPNNYPDSDLSEDFIIIGNENNTIPDTPFANHDLMEIGENNMTQQPPPQQLSSPSYDIFQRKEGLTVFEKEVKANMLFCALLKLKNEYDIYRMLTTGNAWLALPPNILMHGVTIHKDFIMGHVIIADSNEQEHFTTLLGRSGCFFWAENRMELQSDSPSVHSLKSKYFFSVSISKRGRINLEDGSIYILMVSEILYTDNTSTSPHPSSSFDYQSSSSSSFSPSSPPPSTSPLSISTPQSQQSSYNNSSNSSSSGNSGGGSSGGNGGGGGGSSNRFSPLVSEFARKSLSGFQPLRFSTTHKKRTLADYFESLPHIKLKKLEVTFHSFIKQWEEKHINFSESQLKFKFQDTVKKLSDNILSSSWWSSPLPSKDEIQTLNDDVRNHLLEKYYAVLFSIRENQEKDLLLGNYMNKLNQFVTYDHLEIHRDRSDPYENLGIWQNIQHDILDINLTYHPEKKLSLLVGVCKSLYDIVGRDSSNSLSEFLSVILLLLIRTNPPKIYSNLIYINSYCYEFELEGENLFYYTNVRSCVNIIQHLSPLKIKISEDEYDMFIKDITFTSIDVCLSFQHYQLEDIRYFELPNLLYYYQKLASFCSSPHIQHLYSDFCSSPSPSPPSSSSSRPNNPVNTPLNRHHHHQNNGYKNLRHSSPNHYHANHYRNNQSTNTNKSFDHHSTSNNSNSRSELHTPFVSSSSSEIHPDTQSVSSTSISTSASTITTTCGSSNSSEASFPTPIRNIIISSKRISEPNLLLTPLISSSTSPTKSTDNTIIDKYQIPSNNNSNSNTVDTQIINVNNNNNNNNINNNNNNNDSNSQKCSLSPNDHPKSPLFLKVRLNSQSHFSLISTKLISSKHDLETSISKKLNTPQDVVIEKIIWISKSCVILNDDDVYSLLHNHYSEIDLLVFVT